jgi:hypothetical protein
MIADRCLGDQRPSLPDTLNGPRAFIEKRKFVPTQET